MADNSKTAFQIGTESLGKMVHPRVHTQRVNAESKSKLKFLELFMATIESACIALGDKNSAALNKLLDEARFSDPVSTEEAAGIEDELIELGNKINQASAMGDASEDLIERARKLLAVRNRTCLNSK